MKPIAQTFYINEPQGGVEAIYITSVDLFFKKKHSTLGVTLEIRMTENGNPTQSRLPFGRKHLDSSSVNVSDDSTVATTFTFDTPVIVQSGQSYALVVIPDAGNPDYLIWTSIINGTDISSKAPIKTNNDTGTLFLSSNDIQFTAVQDEDMKFKIRYANFTSNSGVATYVSLDEDSIQYTDLSGYFIATEKVFMTNTFFNLAKLTYTSNTGSFTTNEIVYQSNGTANVATGILYSMSGGAMKISNTVGSFSNSYQVKGATSLSNAVISAVSQNVVTNSTNTISVPFTDVFSANMAIAVADNNRTVMSPLRIVSINPSSSTIQTVTPITFSDNNSLIAQIRGNGDLYGKYTGPTKDSTYSSPNRTNAVLDFVTANATVNFAGGSGQYIFGQSSGASAKVIRVWDKPYDAIVPMFTYTEPGETSVSLTYKGFENVDSRTPDSEEIPITNNQEIEFEDKERIVMSRSNELANLPVGRIGNYSSTLKAYMTTSNNKISPNMDDLKTNITFAKNQLIAESNTAGYKISVNSNPFNPGDIVTQGNTTYTFGSGVIHKISGSTTLVITSGNGYFMDGYSVVKSGCTSINTTALAVTHFSESLNSGYKFSSRYISKNVILGELQDAEDIRCFLTAYRPAGTNFHVYTKIQNGSDNSNFNLKIWSKLTEISSDALISSSVNKDDFVELQYGFPQSVEVFGQGTTVDSSNAFITVTSTESFAKGDCVYIKDTGSTNFLVRKVARIVNNSVMELRTAPSFSSSNAAIGSIPGMVYPTAGFIYSQNSNIVRYTTLNDTVYDGFKTFAIKIVPLSDFPYIVPRVADMRAIALQV